MTNVNQIATPPNMAVGFLCQRSIFGTATAPVRRANARTRGVSNRARANEAANTSNVRGLKGIVIVDFRQCLTYGGHFDNRLRSQEYHPDSSVAESPPTR